MRSVLRRAAELGIVAGMAVALAGVTVVIHQMTDGDLAVVGFWLFTCCVLGWGMSSHLTGGGRYTSNPVAAGRVLAIVPAFNEDEAGLFAGVRAILAQSIECDVIVVDDGSAVPVVGFDHPRVRWLRQANAGKRAAQITALRATDLGLYDYILTVDSDSAPYPDALEHLLRAMSDPTVWAATGWVYTRNYRDGWIARCADLDIGVAMVMNRSSRTQIGSIETMSGALALYRAALLWDHADVYLDDTVGAGDDQWLTARALLRGKAVGVNEAIVETDMPTGVGKTFQQRVRWSRSTYLMAAFSIVEYRWRQLLPPLINFIYLVTAPLSLAAIAVAAVWMASQGGTLAPITWSGLGAVTAFGLLARAALCALYLLRRQNMPVPQKLLSLLACITTSFVFGIFAITAPKYWALSKLRDVRWSTRDVMEPVLALLAGLPTRAYRGGRRNRPEGSPPLAVLDAALASLPRQTAPAHALPLPGGTVVISRKALLAKR